MLPLAIPDDSILLVNKFSLLLYFLIPETMPSYYVTL